MIYRDFQGMKLSALGFGAMRLPVIGDDDNAVDEAATFAMVDYAREHGCACLRIDTNAINTNARAMYAKLGYKEIGIVPTVFNGLKDMNMVLMEKKI